MLTLQPLNWVLNVHQSLQPCLLFFSLFPEGTLRKIGYSYLTFPLQVITPRGFSEIVANRGIRRVISMIIATKITEEGPKVLHNKPPIIGAGIETKPVNKPRKPLHLPRYSIGTISTCNGLNEIKFTSSRIPFNMAAISRNTGDEA